MPVRRPVCRRRPRPALRSGALTLVLAAALLSAGCGLGPSSEPGASEPGASTSTRPAASTSPTPSSSASSPSASSPRAAETRTIHTDGLTFELPATWEEADLSNVTTIRLNQPTPTEERRWHLAVDPADSTRPGDTPVASLTYLRTDPESPPTAPVEDRRRLVRDWARQAAETLAAAPDEQALSGLSLEGLGCAEGTLEKDGAPRTADVGPSPSPWR